MAISDIQARIAAEAEAAQETVGRTTGNTIKVNQRDGTLEIPGLGSAESPLDLVIVDYVTQNTYYEGIYNPNDPQPPICFAIGKKLNELKPSPNSPEPQAASCATCPMNEFGTAQNGVGKACKNSRILAVLPPDAADGEDLMRLPVSPSGIKSFDKYVNNLSTREKTIPITKITEVSVVPTNNVGYTVAFGNPRPNENLQNDFARYEEASAMLLQEPDMTHSNGEQQATQTKAAPKRRPAIKTAARRRA